MSYRIAQDSQYAGNKYWRWWAWIEADDAELDKVKEVAWILHPTFKLSRVSVTDRTSRFQLKTSGWGTFLLRAEVELKDGSKQKLKHQLRLEYPETSPSPAPKRTSAGVSAAQPVTVFLSFSAQDSRLAARLRDDLKKAGFDVLDQTRIGAADSSVDAVRRLIADADAVLAIVSDDEISPWVLDELGTALSWDKPAIALLWPQASGAGIPSEVSSVRVDTSNLDSSQVADLLRTATRG